MNYAYFPGCTAQSTGIEYSLSLEFLCGKIGLCLTELPDWNCCGATAGHAVDEDLALALPARSLALLEQEGQNLDVVAPCAACYSRLKHTVHAMRNQPEQAERIRKIIGMPYRGESQVLSLLDVLDTDEAHERIGQSISRPLAGLKVACYYGCLFVRPTAITGVTDAENPQSMERILELTGATPVDWAFKTECCGASQQVAMPQASRPLIYNILHNARVNGAQAIAAACPLCMMNLDMREGELNRTANAGFDMPIFYFTELLALAMGAEQRAIGLNRHFYPTAKLLNQVLGDQEVRP